MHLSYTQVVKRPALLHRLTGLTVKEFEVLLESFSAQYDQQVIQPRLRAPSRNTVNLRPKGGKKGQKVPSLAYCQKEKKKEGTFSCTDYGNWMSMTRYVNRSAQES
jgi:hypothetical protein